MREASPPADRAAPGTAVRVRRVTLWRQLVMFLSIIGPGIRPNARPRMGRTPSTSRTSPLAIIPFAGST